MNAIPASDPINIQIDAEALRAQVRSVLAEEMLHVATRLEMAAFGIGGEKYVELRQQNDEYVRERARQQAFDDVNAGRIDPATGEAPVRGEQTKGEEA